MSSCVTIKRGWSTLNMCVAFRQMFLYINNYQWKEHHKGQGQLYRKMQKTQRIAGGVEWGRWWEAGKMSNPASEEKGSPHWPGVLYGTFSWQNMWKQKGAVALMGTQGGRWILLSFPRLITSNKNTSQLTSGPSMEELCLVWYPQLAEVLGFYLSVSTQDWLCTNHYVTLYVFTYWEKWMWPYMSIWLDKHLNPVCFFSHQPPSLMSYCSCCLITTDNKHVFIFKKPLLGYITWNTPNPSPQLTDSLLCIFHVVPSVISYTS